MNKKLDSNHNWSDYFRIKGTPRNTTFWVVRRNLPYWNNHPVSPDFRTRGLAIAWIRENWEHVLFEKEVLNGP